MRRTASQPPLKAPYRSTASSAYAEHVGENLQHGLCIGLMNLR